MIIENMEQFGKAVDEGRNIDLQIAGEWEPYNYGGVLSSNDLKKIIKGKRLRLAPVTIELYEYEGYSVNFWFTEECKSETNADPTGRTATATINEEGDK